MINHFIIHRLETAVDQTVVCNPSARSLEHGLLYRYKHKICLHAYTTCMQELIDRKKQGVGPIYKHRANTENNYPDSNWYQAH